MRLRTKVHNWRRERLDYFSTRRWKVLRARVLARDKACVECGGTHCLNVYHRTYQRWRREWLQDLVTLCATCGRDHPQARPQPLAVG